MTSSPRSGLFIAHTLYALAASLGAGSLLAFSAFLFFGSLHVVQLRLGEAAGAALNTCLCLSFFLQHSSMVRVSFRHWMGRFINKELHAASYAIVSGLALLVLVSFWQSSPFVIASAHGLLRWLPRAAFFLSIGGFAWGVRSLGGFDAFGLRSITRHLRGTDPLVAPFVIRGPYRWVRHPLYFFSLVMIWSCPDLTLDRLQFNAMWTGWIFLGTALEERDLVANLGNSYRDYQRKVPMLIPWRF